MTHVGVVYVDEGDSSDAEVVGLPVDGQDAYEVVDVDLSEEQAGQVRGAWGVYTARLAHARELIEQARQTIRDARAVYDGSVTSWLGPLHRQAVEAEEAREHVAWQAQIEAEERERQRLLDAEDAELGERLFVTTDRPLRETRRMLHDAATCLRLHRRGCTLVDDHLVRRQTGLRMGEACERYLLGAITCGRCKPDELMAADPVDGARVRTERRNRESKVVTVTQHQLKDAIRSAPWKLGNRAGLVMMSTQTFDVPPGAAVVGWRDPADNFGHTIPEEHREPVYQAAATRRGWEVRWNEQPGREGYLIVRAKTKAEARQEREGG